jgi:hypothetical protein
VIVNQAEASLRLAMPAPRRFAPYHRWDRNFFLLYVALIWFGIAMGFVPQIAQHMRTPTARYPLIVHIHAAAFVGWLILLTAQVLLVRGRRLDLHRKLGVLGAGLAVFMCIIGPATALFMQRQEFGTPGDSPAFLAIQFTDILAFAGLIAPALLWRRNPTVHKRLVMLATLYITDAGFSRWLGDLVGNSLAAHPFVSEMASLYLCPDLLVAGLGVYDLTTRQRLHPAYIAGAAWIVSMQLTGTSLLLSNAWKPIALSLIGH